MLRLRQIVEIFYLMSLFCVWFVAAQDIAHEKSAPTDLDLVTIGDAKTQSGHPAAFRIYVAPDRTKGQVLYTEFNSPQAAQQQIEEWLKTTRKVTSRERNQNKGDQLIDERILAVSVTTKSGKKEFVIIRRDGLKCYLIDSVSLQVAMQVEGLIEHK